MATGPEHYRLAERFLERYGDGEKRSHAEIVEIIGMAQAHATLALAAATWFGADAGVPLGIRDEWRRAVTTQEGDPS